MKEHNITVENSKDALKQKEHELRTLKEEVEMVQGTLILCFILH